MAKHGPARSGQRQLKNYFAEDLRYRQEARSNLRFLKVNLWWSVARRRRRRRNLSSLLRSTRVTPLSPR